MREVNEAGKALIKSFEGCRLETYPDPGTGGAPLTIGYGHTGPGVKWGLKITQAEAEALFTKDINTFAGIVERFCQVPMTDNQFAALVSFAYNVKGWKSSTLFRYVRDRKMGDAAEQFHKWDHSGGKVLPGLTRRRSAEKALFLTP